ncbi:hypothetical protein EUTSA_v10009803mg [Eutrema salsugineum]|uniref:Uncharacterized protein n=1 Tax=Eutrema salsugineum TaxID=72664 RepID=V4KY12_EUTSA|nr:4-substituted benzoates-glutamate ligase GH3.12 [Eutrema salsugineum]ESQ36219.1 hypothetical protein EUTSA_v10009803mg [Eutrema salsugineum]
MSLSSDLNDMVDEKLKVFEDIMSNAKQIQDSVLKEILTLNANTEYLRSFLNGRSDKELFKKKVPVMTYEDIRPYIERVANGEPSDVISAKPIIGFLLSSGTSGEKGKIFPLDNKYFENIVFFTHISSLLTCKHVNGAKQGKELTFNFTKPAFTTPSGLPVSSLTSSFLKSDYFKNRPPNDVFSLTSPDKVIFCPDNKQSMYCHILCGLVQRDEVVSLASPFASVLVRAIIFLSNNWKELCSNIRSGQLSKWIKDVDCRSSVSLILGGPNLELADLIEQECSQKSWEGIITRIWPKTKYLESIVTGQMAHYIPTLDFYSNKLPFISPFYASSETMFGINVNPLCKPQDVSYTFLPNVSYFEFLLVNEVNKVEIVDLVDVKLGCYYEPLVTNYAGLHRYRIGDIVQVTGFYNSTPQFKFVQRKNVVLSVHLETTTEEQILNAVTQARSVLESSDLMLIEFTCVADTSAGGLGHYVFYWELKSKTNNANPEIDDELLVECCELLEKSLDIDYWKYRSKDGPIGALEIRVVQQGTFDSIMDIYISRGASITQYKTPICIKSAEALAILEDRILVRVFSNSSP